MKRADRRSWPDSFLRRHDGSAWPEARRLGILLVSLVSSLAVVIVAGQFHSLFNYINPADFEVGGVAPRTVTVERDVLYKDEEGTRLRQEAVEKLLPPIFRINEEIGRSKLQQFEEFRSTLKRLTMESSSLETVFLKLQLNFPGVLQKQELERLLRRNSSEELLAQARELLAAVYQQGLLRQPDVESELLSAGSIELWNWREGRLEKQTILVEDLLTRGNLRNWLQGAVRGRSAEQVQLLTQLVGAFAVENAFLDLEQSLKAKARAVEGVEPVLAKLSRDQVIVRKGDLVTEEEALQVRALSAYSAKVSFSRIVGNALFVLLVYSLCLILLGGSLLHVPLKHGELLFLAALGLSHLVLAGVFVNVLEPPGGLPLAVVLPTSAAAMLVALLLSTRAAFVFSLLSSLLLLPVTGMDLFSFFFALTTGLAAAAASTRAQRRIDLIRAGLVLSGLSSLVLVAVSLLKGSSTRLLLQAVAWGIANGFLGSMLTLGLLPVFEHLLNAASPFRLIELSDLNAPILKRMLSEAPGTYSHSISVANLAESACSAINANPLLARVGAYYHDIGKIEQSEYFIENQSTYNKHDELKPSLSAAVIKAHVKLGMEKAAELDLPAEVRDIIAQHHGRGLIRYFYHRAQENAENRTIPSEEYSYPGERPKTKEAAVVMLADVVEATSRTLRKPTIAKLEKSVWGIIMDRFTSGELGECELTLGDLEVIRRSFVQVLAGYFHSRIEYPKPKEAVR